MALQGSEEYSGQIGEGVEDGVCPRCEAGSAAVLERDGSVLAAEVKERLVVLGTSKVWMLLRDHGEYTVGEGI